MKRKYLRFPGGKSKALTFSYDDGFADDLRLIEIFRQHGLKGTFNLNSGKFRDDDVPRPESGMFIKLSGKEIKEYYTEDVCEVACHSLTHPFPTACDDAVFAYEILQDRMNLEKLLGKQIHGMAYPYGPTDESKVQVCRSAGIYYARTTVATLKFDLPTDWLRMPTTCHHKHPELFNLAEQFIGLEPKYDPKVFYVWGHTYEFPQDNNWDRMETFADKMSGREDIWYATNMEIYNAWRDYTRLEYSVDGNIIHNPNPRSVWLADVKNTYEIQPGETLYLNK